MGLTHIDNEGKAQMVDVGDKKVTAREAIAQGKIYMNEKCIHAVIENRIKKGDVLSVAQIAGIMATKRCAELIPLCHQIPLNKIDINFCVQEEEQCIECECLVRTEGKTGVEMEAIVGVQIALTTIYDMCKAIDKKMRITDIKLKKKTGGKSGDFINEFEER